MKPVCLTKLPTWQGGKASKEKLQYLLVSCGLRKLTTQGQEPYEESYSADTSRIAMEWDSLRINWARRAWTNGLGRWLNGLSVWLKIPKTYSILRWGTCRTGAESRHGVQISLSLTLNMWKSSRFLLEWFGFLFAYLLYCSRSRSIATVPPVHFW